MRDLVVVALLVMVFAVLVTTHLIIALSLATRRPRQRALLALVIVPFAPVLAWREHMRVLAGVWTSAAALYVVLRVLAAI